METFLLKSYNVLNRKNPFNRISKYLSRREFFMLKIHQKFLKIFIACLTLTIIFTGFSKSFQSLYQFISYHPFLILLLCIFIGIELFQNFEELADDVIAPENEEKFHIIKHLNRLALIILSGVLAYIFFNVQQ